jgi:hypothetical protein
MTGEERVERLQVLQDNIQAVYKMFMDNAIDVERARTALDLLQLQSDILDLEDAVSKRMQAALRTERR